MILIELFMTREECEDFDYSSVLRSNGYNRRRSPFSMCLMHEFDRPSFVCTVLRLDALFGACSRGEHGVAQLSAVNKRQDEIQLLGRLK